MVGQNAEFLIVRDHMARRFSMTFRETVLKKIRFDGLARKVRSSLLREGANIDKESMRALFAESDYLPEKVRDLELFVRKTEEGAWDVIVLDNGLDRYKTSIEDVALRKSPTIKEMVSIRNARKILSDGDVLVSRKEKTLNFLQDFLIDGLDFSWKEEDILALAKHGSIHLEAKDEEGVEEDLAVFAEILGLSLLPLVWRNPAWVMYGKKTGENFSDILAFSPADHRLLKVKGPFSKEKKEDADAIMSILLGSGKTDFYGAAVFDELAKMFLEDGLEFYRNKKIQSL